MATPMVFASRAGATTFSSWRFYYNFTPSLTGTATDRLLPFEHRLNQPEVRRSEGGTLRTTLRAAITANDIIGPDVDNPPRSMVLQSVQTPNYEGLLTGPTLVVKPGDTLIINLVNDFPENPEQDRQSSQFPHDPYTTNLHTHGLLVTPIGVGDNVFREMPPFPETLDNNYHFRVDIPFDHPAGTFWYHPHKQARRARGLCSNGTKNWEVFPRLLPAVC